MEIKFRNRDVKVRVSFDLEDPEPLTLSNGKKILPHLLRITYSGAGNVIWHLEAVSVKKDGTAGARRRDASTHSFPYDVKAGGYQIPEWITELIKEHTPKTLDI
jgi:hypothetical protein